MDKEEALKKLISLYGELEDRDMKLFKHIMHGDYAHMEWLYLEILHFSNYY